MEAAPILDQWNGVENETAVHRSDHPGDCPRHEKGYFQTFGCCQASESTELHWDICLTQNKERQV